MDSKFPLAKHFENAAEKIKIHGAKMTNEDKLKCYALYKQATVGDNTTDQPSFYQLEAKAKWGAWNNEKNKSQEQAKHEYVEFVSKFFPDEVKKDFTA